MSIIYIDRQSGKKLVEKIYKKKALEFLYGDQWYAKKLGPSLLPLVAKLPLFSQFYGYLQKQPSSAKKIRSFITEFDVNEMEFLEPVDQFNSFNDFFIRKLKKEARPICNEVDTAIIPADGRYYFYQDVSKVPGFILKDKKFSLASLIQNEHLAKEYADGSMMIARLCPSDYHRFHFPCAGTPGPTQLINGWLYSVNPIAIKKNIAIFTENKRTLCELTSDQFGKVLYLAIGATNVGSIVETYSPCTPCEKGDEKGYFEFGGSALVLLFQKGRIAFDADLLSATNENIEMRCLFGQSMGKVFL